MSAHPPPGSWVLASLLAPGCLIPSDDCPTRPCPQRPECWEPTYNKLREVPPILQLDRLEGDAATLRYTVERTDGTWEPADADLGLVRVDGGWAFAEAHGYSGLDVDLPDPPPFMCEHRAELRQNFDLPPYDPIEVVAIDGWHRELCLWGDTNCFRVEGGQSAEP